MEKKIKGIKIDVRSKNSLYITIGKWTIYIDNSTGEKIIDNWEEQKGKYEDTRSIKTSRRFK